MCPCRSFSIQNLSGRRGVSHFCAHLGGTRSQGHPQHSLQNGGGVRAGKVNSENQVEGRTVNLGARRKGVALAI